MTEKNRRIGFYGGSFNPPTLAHKQLAEFVFSELQLDELHWIVTPQNPDKQLSDLAPFQHRLTMVKQVLGDQPNMIATDVEERLGSSWTINTVKALREQFPNETLFFIMGMDNWAGFHNWGDDFEKILDFVSLVILRRPHAADEALASELFKSMQVAAPSDLKKSGSWCFVENPLLDMAATQVRKTLQQGQTPEHITKETLDYIRRHQLYRPEDDQARFYLFTGEVWDAMYQDCQQATKSIEFEQYILENDPTGQSFLQLFIEKARKGVAIRLLLDRVGSRSLFSSPLIKELREAGGKVYFYNPISWMNIFLPSTWFPRNHTKTMLVDGQIGYVGSACLAQHMRFWRDTHMRFTGELVNMAQHHFMDTWQHFIKNDQKITAYYPKDNGDFTYIVSKPRILKNPIYKAIIKEIDKAQHSVRIATPYFLPPARLYHALKRATRRGVKVEIVSGIKTDVPISDYVSHSYFPKLLRHKINIYLYRKTIFHTKYAIIDDRWATLGSTNMDYLSLLKNREANILIHDQDTIKILNAHFDDDISESLIVTKDYWKNTSLYFKMMGYLGRIIKKVL